MIKFLNKIGSGDIEFIAIMLRKYRLSFWSSVFYEYNEILFEGNGLYNNVKLGHRKKKNIK